MSGNKNNDMRQPEDWELARKGIQMVLNNRYDDAKALFESKEDSVQLAIGHCYMVFMNAVMTFEDDCMRIAGEKLKSLESQCAYNMSWFKAFKSKIFGSTSVLTPYELLEQQIILADCQVCQALLNMIGQDSAAGFMKGGWALKKAWSLYLSCYNNLSAEYKKCFGNDIAFSVLKPIRQSKSVDIATKSERPTLPTSKSCHDSKLSSIPFPIENSISTQGLSEADEHLCYNTPDVHTTKITALDTNASEVNRLMRAVCFGYGLFHLCVSLLPPAVLRLIQILGFVGDRQAGLLALEIAKQGPDLRAPLATLALLWYHTIMNPLFAVDPQEINFGIEAAEVIVDESKTEFTNSAIFFFFRGRIHRLKNQVSDAVQVYSSAVAISGQRELSLLCLHEVGWCHLVQLDFSNALSTFWQLKEESRWSRIFYTYLAAVCCGSINEMNRLVQLTQTLRQRSRPRVSQLDQLILHRIVYLMPTKTPHFYRLLAYEMLYLWNSMPGNDGLQSIVDDIDTNGKLMPGANVLEPMIGLSALLSGVCLANLGKYDDAAAKFTSVRVSRVEEEKRYKARIDLHISAYALYELAMVLIKRNKISDAKVILDSALAVYTNYDFEHRLKMKVSIALKAINDLGG